MSLLMVRRMSCWWNFIQSLSLINCDGFISWRCDHWSMWWRLWRSPCHPTRWTLAASWSFEGDLRLFPNKVKWRMFQGEGYDCAKDTFNGNGLWSNVAGQREWVKSQMMKGLTLGLNPQLNSDYSVCFSLAHCLVLHHFLIFMLWFRWGAFTRWNWRVKWRLGKGERLPWRPSCLWCWMESRGCSCYLQVIGTVFCIKYMWGILHHRMLGYGIGIPETGSAYGLADPDEVFKLTHVTCSGTELTLLDCLSR